MPAKLKQSTFIRKRAALSIVTVALLAISPSASFAQVPAQNAQAPANRPGQSTGVGVSSTQSSVGAEKQKFIQTQGDDTLEIPGDKGILHEDQKRPNKSGHEDWEGTPYIGITVRDTVMRTLGPLGRYLPQYDVAGMEIETIDAGSPAAEAGLHGVRTGTKDYALNGLVRAPSQLVDQSMATMDVYDTGGDLITEVNGRRVLNTLELNREFKAQKLKPGDTVYFTVVRRVRSWHSKTMRLPVRLGEWTTPRTVTIQDKPNS